MIFRTVALRLTAIFSVLLLAVFAGLGAGIYVYVVASFDYDQPGAGIVVTAEQSFADLRTGLLIGFLVLLAVVPVMCYLMIRVGLRPAEVAYRDQQRFVDDASHELRTPLAVIQAELELALDRPRPVRDYHRAIGVALEEVGHLVTLTGDLLLLARGSSLGSSSAFGAVDVNGAVRRVAGGLSRVSQPLTSAGAVAVPRLRTHLLERPVYVSGSADLLERAIANLVDNAVKFSADTATVEISVVVSGDTVTIAVTDHGVGMTDEAQARVFDRFWRAPESRNMPGYGLGLPLVRQIARAHHGKALIVQSSSEGTTVAIELPSLRRHAVDR